MTTQSTAGSKSAMAIEETGIEVIKEEDRKGTPASLFWPWFASNISVFAISYGSWILGYGLSFLAATLVAILGAILSFLLVGIIALAGKRGSAPTLTISRAVFGKVGNLFPGVVSYLLLVGWEIVLVALATLATNTVLGELGMSTGNHTLIIAFIIIIGIVVLAGVVGFDFIMRIQTVLTIVLGIATIGYMILTFDKIDFSALGSLATSGPKAVIGAFVMVVTALGIGWVNCAADYSRYLPRSASSKGVVFWTTFGASLAPIILIVYGLLLVGSNPDMSQGISDDPIGTLATMLPSWYLIIFVLVAVGGLVSGAVLDIYSSGLTLLAIGLPVKRWVAAALDGVLMIAGTIFVVWIAEDFFGPFQAFLITLGVPMAAWAGIFIGDMVWRKRDYHEASLFSSKGIYGSVNWPNFIGLVVLTIVGWGMVMSETMTWQGYLLKPFGNSAVEWGWSSIGVFVALVGGFLVGLASKRSVEAQEAKQAELESQGL